MAIRSDPVLQGRFQGLQTLNLAVQYRLASLVVLVLLALLLGWWVGLEIEVGVVHRTASATSLFVENFIVLELQDLDKDAWLAPERVKSIEKLLSTTRLGKEIVNIKIWGPGGRVVYGTDAGKVFPIKEDQQEAWYGAVSSHISNLEDAENATQRSKHRRLLETYTPIRLEGTDQVIAVAEFYQSVESLEREIFAAKLRSWALVSLAVLAAYILLSGLVQRGSDTIQRQQGELQDKVVELNQLLLQNEELHERIRRAASRTASLNERFLRRISAELHDGPAQDLSYAMLRLDGVGGYLAKIAVSEADKASCRTDLEGIHGSLGRALHEIRSISTELRLPELEELTPIETLARAIRDHRRRTGTDVSVELGALPNHISMPIKITLFRLVQEALNNAYRHAGGINQKVNLEAKDKELKLVISDGGKGFDWKAEAYPGRLGLVGMRERVESLGGVFEVFSGNRGTQIQARIPLEQEEEHV